MYQSQTYIITEEYSMVYCGFCQYPLDRHLAFIPFFMTTNINANKQTKHFRVCLLGDKPLV